MMTLQDFRDIESYYIKQVPSHFIIFNFIKREEKTQKTQQTQRFL